MTKKRQMSAEEFTRKFSKIATDYLETVPVEDRNTRITALKNRISKSGRGSRPTTARTSETPAIRLAARSHG